MGQSRDTLGMQRQPSQVCYAAERRLLKCFLPSVSLPVFQNYEEIPTVCHKKYVVISVSACVLNYLNSAILIVHCCLLLSYTGDMLCHVCGLAHATSRSKCLK